MGLGFKGSGGSDCEEREEQTGGAIAHKMLFARLLDSARRYSDT